MNVMWEVTGGTGSGSLGLQVSHWLSLGISSPWEGRSLQSQQSPKMSKHQKHKIKKHEEYSLPLYLPAHRAFCLSGTCIFFTASLRKKKPGATIHKPTFLKLILDKPTTQGHMWLFVGRFKTRIHIFQLPERTSLFLYNTQ